MRGLKSLYIILIFVITAIVIGAVLFFRFGRFGTSIKDSLKAGETITEELEIQSFKDIDIDADVISFEIRRGDDYHVEYSFPERIKPQIKVDDDCLKVSVKGRDALALFGSGFNNNSFKFYLYVPGDAALGKLSADVDAGEIKLNDISFEKITVDADAANVELTGINSDNTKVTADAGNIEIKNSVLGDLEIVTDAGNAEVHNSRCERVEANTEMGNIEFKNTDFVNGSFESSMGNIEIKGNFDSLEVDCSLGAVSVDSDNLENAKIDIDVSLGAIKVGGKTIVGKNYRQ